MDTKVVTGQAQKNSSKKARCAEGFLESVAHGVGDVFAGTARGVGTVCEGVGKGALAVGKVAVECVGAVISCAGDICNG